MKHNRSALWLILASQVLILASSLIEPPSGMVIIILRVILPLLMVAYISLILAGVISPGKR